MAFEPLDGCLRMVVESGANDSDGTPFAAATQYYPYDGQGACGQLQANSPLHLRTAQALIYSVLVTASSGETITIRNANGAVILKASIGSAADGPYELIGNGEPIVSVGLFSIETSTLLAEPNVSFKVTS